MHDIGRITLVQVQPASLKIEQYLHAYYDPTPLLVVEKLQLTPHGVIGVTAGGKQIMDIHHVDYPKTHNRKGKNGVSIGFTSHYHAMRTKFGEHLVDGCAGENILVEASRSFKLADLGSRLAIQNQHTGQFAYLSSFKVAAPCVEFSQFAADYAMSGMPLPPERMKEALQFLNHGQRGFYATVVDQEEQIAVQAGDRVFMDDADYYSP